jgi:hypothetical protein
VTDPIWSYSSGVSTYTNNSANFEDWMLGWLFTPDVNEPCYLQIIEVTSATSIKVKGDARGLSEPDDQWRIHAPPGVDNTTGGLHTDLTTSGSRYLYGSMRYMPPQAGFEVVGTVYGRQGGESQWGTVYCGHVLDVTLQNEYSNPGVGGSTNEISTLPEPWLRKSQGDSGGLGTRWRGWPLRGSTNGGDVRASIGASGKTCDWIALGWDYVELEYTKYIDQLVIRTNELGDLHDDLRGARVEDLPWKEKENIGKHLLNEWFITYYPNLLAHYNSHGRLQLELISKLREYYGPLCKDPCEPLVEIVAWELTDFKATKNWTEMEIGYEDGTGSYLLFKGGSVHVELEFTVEYLVGCTETGDSGATADGPQEEDF